MDRLAIFGVPRSGTSWLGEIVNSSEYTCYKYQPLFSYAHKGFLSKDSDIEKVNIFFDNLIKCKDNFTNQFEEREKGHKPTFYKKTSKLIAFKEVRYIHLIPQLMQTDVNLKTLFIIRNPLDVLNSWINAPREFRHDLGWNINEEWRHAKKKNADLEENYFGYQKWKEAYIIFNQLKEIHQERVLIIQYENLIDNPVEITDLIFRFCNLEFTEQTHNFLKYSTTKETEDSYSVYRKQGKIKGSRMAINKDIINTICKESERDLKLSIKDNIF